MTPAGPEPPGTVVLVEGFSDQEAVVTLAARLGRDLAAAGVHVQQMGGAHSIRRVVAGLDGVRLVGLCDQREEPLFRRALAEVFVCVADLEEELIRALEPAGVERVIADLGELQQWQSFQRQPFQRGRPVAAQLRRFMGTHSGRKALYARALVEACDLDRVPAPLADLLAAVS